MTEAVRDVHFGMTLLVPGIRPQNFDHQFLKLLRPDFNVVPASSKSPAMMSQAASPSTPTSNMEAKL